MCILEFRHNFAKPHPLPFHPLSQSSSNHKRKSIHRIHKHVSPCPCSRRPRPSQKHKHTNRTQTHTQRHAHKHAQIHPLTQKPREESEADRQTNRQTHKLKHGGSKTGKISHHCVFVQLARSRLRFVLCVRAANAACISISNSQDRDSHRLQRINKRVRSGHSGGVITARGTARRCGEFAL